MQLEENLVVADRFRLVRMIGRGGMGSVWQAVHIALDQPCAVKFIEGEFANVTEAHARFEREAKAAAQLRSPHVVQILDHGVWQGRPYIAMELLEGEDLGKALARAGGKLAPGHVNAIIQQVARALTRAHAAGVVHRDLKPDNIFIVNDDDRELVKILDFGVAKSTGQALDGSNTKTGAMLGTPYYMSPEQAQGIKSVDSRSDLWSLAVIVFQCVTGRLPFESEALGDLLVKIIIQPIPVPSKVGPVPAGFDRWWSKAAERNPEMRFQTAKDFANELAVALGSTATSDSAIRPAVPLQGTAMMQGPGTPRPYQDTPQPYPQTPQPYPQTPQPYPQTPQPYQQTPQPGALASYGTPATFSGTAPAPSKGAPIGLIAGGLALALAIGAGAAFVTTRGPSTPQPAASATASASTTAAAATAPPPAASSVASAETAPVPPPEPPPSAAPTVAVAKGHPVSVKPGVTAVASTAKPVAAPSASTKKWNPGF